MKSHSTESKAFSKSKKTAIPGISFVLVKSIVSAISLMLSSMNLPFT